MFCPNCGEKISDDSKFCGECGAIIESVSSQASQQEIIHKQEDVQTNKNFSKKSECNVSGEKGIKPSKAKNKKKLSKVKLILLLIFIIILAILAGSGFWYFNSSAFELTKELRKGEYENVVDIYNDECVENAVEKAIVDQLLERDINSGVNSYNESELSYEEIYEILTIYTEIEDAELLELAQNALEQIITNYENAMLELEADEAYETGDYLAAIEKYEQIDTDIEGYDEIASKVVEAKEAYKVTILEQTESATEENDYVNYISLVTTALSVMPEDEELLARKSELESGYTELVKEDTLEQVGEFVKELDYEAALELLENRLASLGEDEDLVNLLVSTQEAYVAYITDEVSVLVDDNKFDEAIALLEKSVDVLPGETSFENLLTEVSDMKPVELSILSVGESDYVEVITDNVVTKDVTGNTYNPGNLFFFEKNSKIPVGEGWQPSYIKVYLGGGYSELIFTLAVSEDGDEGEATFTIFGTDDEIIFYQSEITRLTIPKEYSVDVTDVEWIYISRDTISGTVQLLMADPLLYK